LHRAHARVQVVWRDSLKKPIRATSTRWASAREAWIYPLKVDVIKDKEANITTGTLYYERVPFDYILVSIKRKV
jgi:hypothetical protein